MLYVCDPYIRALRMNFMCSGFVYISITCACSSAQTSQNVMKVLALGAATRRHNTHARARILRNVQDTNDRNDEPVISVKLGVESMVPSKYNNGKIILCRN